jgi:hypothetical protein
VESHGICGGLACATPDNLTHTRCRVKVSGQKCSVHFGTILTIGHFLRIWPSVASGPR